MTTPMNGDMAAACLDLVEELCTEIDLHYEDEDLPAASHLFDNLQNLMRHLKQAGCENPKAYDHVMSRYDSALRRFPAGWPGGGLR
jgi:hypothetical protein